MAEKKPRIRKASYTDNYMFLTYEVEQLVRDISENLKVTNQKAFMLLYGAGRRIIKNEIKANKGNNNGECTKGG